MYKAMDIAQYIITKCTRDGSPVSNLQLQKILYWVQGEYLAISGRPLFQEDFFSWQIGPVMPNVYYRFCGYGASKILGRYPGIMIEKDTKALIDQIVEEKRALYPWVLRTQTQKEGGAWDRIYQNGKGDHQVIPSDMIRADFLETDFNIT